MDVKQTVGFGAILVLAGVAACVLIPYVWHSFLVVFFGSLTLLFLLAGALLIVMGTIQVREDRASQLKDQQDSERQEMMAAHSES